VATREEVDAFYDAEEEMNMGEEIQMM